jgi:hypothetical protein
MKNLGARSNLPRLVTALNPLTPPLRWVLWTEGEGEKACKAGLACVGGGAKRGLEEREDIDIKGFLTLSKNNIFYTQTLFKAFVLLA